jgi:hypothetical protein
MRGNLRAGVFITSIAAVALLATSSVRAQTTNAFDAGDDGSYGPLPQNDWPATNGGFGYGLWTPDADAGGGGTYMEGPTVNSRGVPTNNYSFALYPGNGSYDISRPLTTSLSSGDFSIYTRFDIAGAGPNLVDLRIGNNTNGYNSGELLSFGIVNGNELSYTDSSGFHLLASGEARGDVWSWNVAFNATAGTYSLTVTNFGGGYGTTVSGNLESNNVSVGSFSVINSSSGNNQNVIFNDPMFTTVPEPSTMALVGISLLGAWTFRRRKH